METNSKLYETEKVRYLLPKGDLSNRSKQRKAKAEMVRLMVPLKKLEALFYTWIFESELPYDMIYRKYLELYQARIALYKKRGSFKMTQPRLYAFAEYFRPDPDLGNALLIKYPIKALAYLAKVLIFASAVSFVGIAGTIIILKLAELCL